MFKEIIQVWRGKETMLDEIVGDFQEMLHIGAQMYSQVLKALFEGSGDPELKKTIYKQDAQLNAIEQTIRRKIVSLLSGGGEEPIASCLILMSISKDAERLGDYAKNILSVFEKRPQLAKVEPYYARLVQMKESIISSFAGVIEAQQHSDTKRARDIVKKSYEVQKMCNDTVAELLLSEGGPDYVAYAVLIRFFKRSLAHLSNIATSIFMPVTKIDFFDEIRRDEY
jgi:phosphate transport system protein